MKTVFILFLTGIHFQFSVAQVTDNFSDGDFTTNPTWNGDITKFEVNAGQQLHLNAPAVTDTAYISTANTFIDNIEWNFFFILDFSPSATNYLKVYLVSDQPNFKQALNGYFLKIGENGSADAIDLYLQQGLTETLIISGIDGHVTANTNSVSVKVTRDGSGNWSVFSDTTGGTNYILEGSGTDNTITSTSYFGFYCNYTSSRSTSFYFDNVYVGPPIIDTDPPEVITIHATSPTQLDIQFNEAVDMTTAENENNYSVNNGIGNPVTSVIDVTKPALIHLTFLNTFPNGVSNTITIAGISDLSGNISAPVNFEFLYYTPQPLDIIINEFMPDPEPAIGLPVAEYTELYNNSDFPIDLTSWVFSDASSSELLPPFILQPDSFVILCDDENVEDFQIFGNVLALGSFPSLNNDGDDISLTDATGNIINALSYNDTWYKDEVKAEGGWSLERINANNPCTGNANWHASADMSGGTPGQINSDLSSFTDTLAPVLLNASLGTASTITLTFDEALDFSAASNPANFSLHPSDPGIVAVIPSGDLTQVDLSLATTLDSNQVYTVIISGLFDCSGNTMQFTDSIQVALPASIGMADILINEILFNPISDGYDYVEIYNNTNSIFDLKELSIANADETDSISDISGISAETYLFFPQQYLVITEDAEWVKLHYYTLNPDWFIEVNDLPSFNDDEGKVVLVNILNNRVDELHYLDDWHFPLIDEPEGISLERLDFNRPTQDSMNWHSAASTAGYGTPGYKNSQYSEAGFENEITLSPQVFSPDQDGHDDILNISYQFDNPGLIANVKIFDSHGREVRNLVRNALISQSGNFTWDGISNNEDKARVGSYVVFVEILNLDGSIQQFKKVCIVAGKKQ